MTRTLQHCIATLIAVALLLAGPSAGAQEAAPTDEPAPAAAPAEIAPEATSTTLYLPTISGFAGTPSPFGFDLRTYAQDDIMPYVSEAQPRWSRAGGLFWANVEPVRGGGYQWANIADLETNIVRLRASGIEPMVVVQWSPPWAQSIPGELCSPPKPEYVADFVRFVAAAAERYSSGPLKVDYWEIWNEPDYHADQVGPVDGTGCWATKTGPYYGGDYYGQVLKQVYPAIKSANPSATVIGGAFAHFWPDDTVTIGFLRGMLDAGAGSSFDTLSFHAYNDYGAGDRLLFKANRLRAVLAQYKLDKPLMSTEIAATCVEWQGVPNNVACPSNFTLKQANYAARIYAVALALNLQGALWFTLATSSPGFLESHLIDVVDGKLVPRPAFYSFRNSARALQGTRYIGAPLQDPPPSQRGEVQVLTFQKAGRLLYVLWVPETNFPKAYNLAVPPGSVAICTDQLNLATPAIYYCSDTNRDGLIPRAINELPQYVEVIP